MPLYPTVAPEGALRGDPGLAAAAAVLGELPAQLRRSVISVTAPNPGQVTLRLHGGITVLWGDTSRAAVKKRELAVLLRAHLRYYDVSAPGSVDGQVTYPGPANPRHAAWLVDPGALRPYCPYQSCGRQKL